MKKLTTNNGDAQKKRFGNDETFTHCLLYIPHHLILSTITLQSGHCTPACFITPLFSSLTGVSWWAIAITLPGVHKHTCPELTGNCYHTPRTTQTHLSVALHTCLSSSLRGVSWRVNGCGSRSIKALCCGVPSIIVNTQRIWGASLRGTQFISSAGISSSSCTILHIVTLSHDKMWRAP